jgi:hypothetical protein
VAKREIGGVEEVGGYLGDGWLFRGWVANLVERLLAKAALWVRIQTSLKNAKWPTHSSPPKNK